MVDKTEIKEIIFSNPDIFESKEEFLASFPKEEEVKEEAVMSTEDIPF